MQVCGVIAKINVLEPPGTGFLLLPSGNSGLEVLDIA